MTATAISGIWTEELSPEVSINFDTTRKPERITIQKKGEEPIHKDYEDGITVKDVFSALKLAKESFNIK